MSLSENIRKRHEVRSRILSCTRCELHLCCNSPVAWSGKAPNNIAILGEAPGAEEDARGIPFVGRAGTFLREQLEAAGFDSSALSYLNTVSCYPDGTPTKKHREKCKPNLLSQLRFIQPKYVLVLGSIAVSTWWTVGITAMRGEWWRIPEPSIASPWALSTWHPSYILRSGGERSKKGRKFFNDLVAFHQVTSTDQFATEESSAAPTWEQEQLL